MTCVTDKGPFMTKLMMTASLLTTLLFSMGATTLPTDALLKLGRSRAAVIERLYHPSSIAIYSDGTSPDGDIAAGIHDFFQSKGIRSRISTVRATDSAEAHFESNAAPVAYDFDILYCLCGRGELKIMRSVLDTFRSRARLLDTDFREFR